ncbi:MAG: hypothetical protein H6Q33_626 [Deltaproteobacteria bacterium]|nr:hypothetical protein [Deltaproteobacteria bacterium]
MSLRAESPWPAAGYSMRWLRFVRHLPNFVRLYWRLFCDARVSIWPKALLVVSLLYLVFPVDFIPDVLPFLGEVDDLVLLIVACRLFMHMCPPHVVQEHVHRIATGE